MPYGLSPEILEYLARIGEPLTHLAQDPETFQFGRGDLTAPKVGDPLSDIAAKWSTPDRQLLITGSPSHETWQVKLPNVQANVDTSPSQDLSAAEWNRIIGRSSEAPQTIHRNYPRLDTSPNETWFNPETGEQSLGNDFMLADINANYASSNDPRFPNTAMQLYPAMWDLLKHRSILDPTDVLTSDNLVRKPAALMSYILRGNDPKSVMFSPEFLRAMGTGKQTPGISRVIQELTKGAPPGDAELRTHIDANWGALDASQQAGLLAATEATKLAGRAGGVQRDVPMIPDFNLQNFLASRWPIERPLWQDTMAEQYHPEALGVLAKQQKMGSATRGRALLEDWLVRRAAAGVNTPKSMLDTDEAHSFMKGRFYAGGGSVRTEAMKEAGNYKKDHLKIAKLGISVENRVGSKRRPEWPKMKAHYGYFKRTKGADGDQVDVFVKPGTPSDWDGEAYVIDQKKPGNGHFDEHKVMLGYDTERAALGAYKGSYTRGWKGLGSVTDLNMDELRSWLKAGDTTKPLASAAAVKRALVKLR